MCLRTDASEFIQKAVNTITKNKTDISPYEIMSSSVIIQRKFCTKLVCNGPNQKNLMYLCFQL